MSNIREQFTSAGSVNRSEPLQLTHYLLLHKLEVENANTISSPITYGFPAVTAFLGAMHRANRRLNRELATIAPHLKINFKGVLIAHHDHTLHTYQRNRFAERTFNQQRTPLIRKGSRVESAPIIEEGRQRLTVSLVVELYTNTTPSPYATAMDEATNERICQAIHSILYTQKLAGGTLFKIGEIALYPVWEEKILTQLRGRLMPSFILQDRSYLVPELLEKLRSHEAIGNPYATGIDLLLELSKIHHVPVVASENSSSDSSVKEEAKRKVEWSHYSIKEGEGWLVPIPVGYQAISRLFEVGELPQARTDQYLSQYVESIYTIGEWQFSGRLQDKAELSASFWHYLGDNEATEVGRYMVGQKRKDDLPIEDSIDHFTPLDELEDDYA